MRDNIFWLLGGLCGGFITGLRFWWWLKTRQLPTSGIRKIIAMLRKELLRRNEVE